MFVEITNLRPLTPALFVAGALSKIFYYILGGKVLYKVTTNRFPTLSPSFLDSSLICVAAYSISSSPVKKSRISPAGSFS